MKKVTISTEIKTKCPELRLGCISCRVEPIATSDNLHQRIKQKQEELAAKYTIEEISTHPINGQTRNGYRACGKKPGRYRPSAEALMRRILQGKDLYSISNVVDLINMTSFSSGYSIGGYDVDKVSGEIVLGVGKENEPYEGLGRGVLNIHKMPVFRDDAGAFGSPTSDSVRTGVTLDTRNFLMIFLDFGSHPLLPSILEDTIMELRECCNASQVDFEIVE